MSRLFWGLLFVLMDVKITLGSAEVGLLPDFAGYFLLMKGMEELAEESKRFDKVRHGAFVMVLVSAVLYVADLLDLTAMQAVGIWVLGLIAHVAGLAVLYGMVSGIRQMERGSGWDLQGEKLRTMWLIQAVMGTIAYLLGWIPLVGTVAGVAGMVTAVCFLAAMFGTKKRFDENFKL
ncbi:MAG: hypothetical protein J6J18_05560 [Oscillospiraceae bacterium]|nr:hypothetical protein [Oscillospiraceae bacterium]